MPQTRGFTIWLTGLFGVGKSTLANCLGDRLRNFGKQVEVLDHDEVGPLLTKEMSDAREECQISVRRLGYVAKLLTRNNCVVVVASVSPHREIRQELRKEIGRFVEVFVDCPTETLIERDSSGLYKKALAGELPNFTGVTEPYETPQHPEITVRTDQAPAHAGAEQVIQALVNIGYLNSEDLGPAAPQATSANAISKPSKPREVKRAKPQRATAAASKVKRPASRRDQAREAPKPKSKAAARVSAKAKRRPVPKARQAKRDRVRPASKR